MRTHEMPKRRVRALAGLLVASLFIFTACGNDDDDSTIEVPSGMADENLKGDEFEEYGEYDDVYENPARYVGERVNVSGVVVDVLDDQIVRINTERGIVEGLLVLYGKTDDPLTVGSDVRVLGRIVELKADELTLDEPPDSGALPSPRLDDEFVIVAHDVTILHEVPY